MRGLWCGLVGHVSDGGTNHFDVPFNPRLIPDRYMDEGFLAVVVYRCRRCGRKLDRKLGHTDEPVEAGPTNPEDISIGGSKE